MGRRKQPKPVIPEDQIEIDWELPEGNWMERIKTRELRTGEEMFLTLEQLLKGIKQ